MVQTQKHRIIKSNLKEETGAKSSFMRAYDDKIRTLAAADQAAQADESEYKRALVEVGPAVYEYCPPPHQLCTTVS